MQIPAYVNAWYKVLDPFPRPAHCHCRLSSTSIYAPSYISFSVPRAHILGIRRPVKKLAHHIACLHCPPLRPGITLFDAYRGRQHKALHSAPFIALQECVETDVANYSLTAVSGEGTSGPCTVYYGYVSLVYSHNWTQ